MKKVLSIMLCLAVLLSLMIFVGCKKEEAAAGTEPTAPAAGTETTPPAGTETTTPPAAETLTKEQLEASKPCEYVQEKLDAGMEVIVGMTTPTFDNAIAIACHTAFQKLFPELGLTYNGMDCASDTAVQIQQIENFITMGTACLYVAAGDPETLRDVLTKAEEAGTRVMFYGSLPSYYVSGTCNVDLDKMGYECGAMASAWLDQAYPDAQPGSIDTAVFGWYFISECGRISDGIKKALAEDARVNVVYTHDDCVGIDAGFTAAEEAYTTSANLRLVCSYDMDAAIGAANYLATIPGADLSQYGVFATNSNSEIEKLLENSANGEGCFRGTIVGNPDPVETPYQVMCELMFNKDLELPYNSFEPLTALSSIGYTANND